MNTELPKAEATYASKGLGYVGAVLYDAGAALANEAIARGGLKSGDRALVWGLEAQAGRGERTKGIHETLTEGRPDGRLPRDRRRDEQGSSQRDRRPSRATSRRILTSRPCSSTTAT